MPGVLVEAWCRGLNAGEDGLPASTNPHLRGTELAGHWADGWREGAKRRREGEESGPIQLGETSFAL